ncbi:MAG: ABC-2 family transporter protein [Spirochaetales bacterium]|nr:ABC-2 family transporter protein [Spirochaetales bacterium]
MSVYFEFFKIAFKNTFAYRVDAYMGILARILSMFIAISLWQALYQNSSIVISRVGFVSIKEMITYSIISTALFIIIENNVIFKLDDKIRTGAIATDLIRPLSFMKLILADFIGNNMANLIIQFIPVLLFANLLFALNFPSLINVILFLAAVVNAVIINFLISYIVGLLSFWWFQIWPMEMFIRSIKRILSGALIPIWFFPGFLQYITNILPFKYIYYIPLSIYLNKFDLKESSINILYQILWIAALLITERIMWKMSVKKLVIQGG